MSEGFIRTEQTARDAEEIARLLMRAAEKRITYLEAERLRHLAERYTDYAAGLRQVIASGGAPEPDHEQAALL